MCTRAMPSRPGIKLVSANPTPSSRFLPSPHTSRHSFSALSSSFLSVSISLIACLALLMLFLQVVLDSPVAFLHLTHTHAAEPIPTTPAKTRLKCAPPHHFAWPLLLAPLIMSAAPLKYTTDPSTMQVLSEWAVDSYGKGDGSLTVVYPPFFLIQTLHSSSKISRRNSTSGAI